MACGAVMRLTAAVPDDSMVVSGFERHTFECPACRDVEQRLIFKSQREEEIRQVPAANPPAPSDIAPTMLSLLLSDQEQSDQDHDLLKNAMDVLWGRRKPS
jgi:hypothetical protein